jgi:hypothetical protein
VVNFASQGARDFFRCEDAAVSGSASWRVVCAISCRCGATVFATTARSRQAADRATSVVRASINGNCLMAAEQVDKVKILTDRISPILHGHNPEIQGAVLAELLATWLAGHVVPGDRMQTILLRGRLFHEHMKIVRDLTKLNAMRTKLEDF